MKFFVSSLIRGMEAERAAVVDAVEGLGHQVVRAENFAATPDSPRVACLQGVRDSDALILIVADRYGQVQPSGKSATHEEYDAASGNKPVFVFVAQGSAPEPKQAAFLRSVQDWQSGGFTAQFASPEQLRRAVSKALHEWILAQAGGAFDPVDAAQRATQLLPPAQRGYSTGKTRLAISISSGPTQTVLRPTELEDAALRQHITKEALFGTPTILTTAKGTDASIDGHTLLIKQDRESISISEDGSIVIVRVLAEPKGSTFPAIIEEEIQEKISSALEFAVALLEHIDPTRRLTNSVIAAMLYEAEHRSWRTRTQQAAQPSSGTMNMRDAPSEAILLQPAHRTRGALHRDRDSISRDLTVLLRRSWNRG